MTNFGPSLRLIGAKALREGRLENGPLSVVEGILCDDTGRVPDLDLSGYWVLPGIIDLHGDAFERHMTPRPTAPFAMNIGLRGTDRDAAVNGITTAYLAQSWSWEGGPRGPEYTEDLLEAHKDYRPFMGTDLRIQIRAETHTMDTEARLLRAIQTYGVDYVIFNNHLDEAIEMAEHRPDMIVSWASKAGRTAEEHMSLVLGCKARDAEVPRYLCNLANAFDRLNVRYGSHDDPDGATRERYSMIGAKVCEFPTAMGAALVAKTWQDPVLMGAPNVVRGGSQSGNIAASEMIAEGACDALVSDYYYPALAQAVFRLVDEGMLSFGEAWHMISTNPAQILGLNDRGVLESGKRADLTIIDPETRTIEATMVAGRWTYVTGEIANRLATVQGAIQVAAE